MPHKHKRGDLPDDDILELHRRSPVEPFSTKPTKYPVYRSRTTKPNCRAKRRRVREDDTPRAFTRIMEISQGKKPRSGLDEGSGKPKQRTRTCSTYSAITNIEVNHFPEQPTVPRILPNERMAVYSARVDAALPVAGLISKNKGKRMAGKKEHHQTKMERKLQRMQKEWREVDARWKLRVLEARAEAEDEDCENETVYQFVRSQRSKQKRRRAEDGQDTADPWAALAEVRKEDEQRRSVVGGKCFV